SEFSIKIQSDMVPIIRGAIDYARMGFVPGGTYRNREFREKIVDVSSSVDRTIQDILFDPQTSGGLLICVDGKSADDLLIRLKNKGMDAAIIGEVLPEPKGRIVVK
ncbi:MAG: selenide, water dikinase SelD, partial [Proteobacteria bacterium]|nr:selenide, water dikinase SelD [Pseudomonadota bacterium]